ncbi:MAG: alpha/beta hydrolase [Pseudomonadota bacterium]
MAQSSVIFLPGFMCDDRLFAPQIKYLSARGYRCEIGDLTGAASIERMASQTLKRAPKHFALIGLSMGAIVAFEMMRQAPERVTHLALLNTTARADAAGAARKQQLKRVSAGELDMVLREDLKPQYLAPANRVPRILDVLDAMGRSLGEEVFVKQTMALSVRRDAFDVLERITCPSLVLAGAEDRVCPVDRHEEIVEGIAGATLEVIPECGHISTLEAPDRVKEALDALLARPSTIGSGRACRPQLRVVHTSN